MSEAAATVLVPGLLCTSALYAPQLEALWSLGTIAIANPSLDDSLAAIAQRVLVQAPARFALVGLSMGGYVAFEILRQAPGRVSRLALLDTTARPDAPEQTELRRSHMALARNGRLAEVNEMQFQRTVHPAHRSDAGLKALIFAMSDAVGVDGYLRQQTAIMARPDSRSLLPQIRCPTLVVVGDADALTPPDRAREMADAIPGARLEVVPECGHISTLEQPQALTRLLADFLRR